MPVVTISAVNDPITENTGMVEFDINLERYAPAGGLKVVVEVTHQETYEVSPLAPGQLRDHTINIAAGQRTARLTLQPVDNTLVGRHKTVVGTIKAGTGYSVGSTNSANVVVTDDDTVTLKFSIDCDQTYQVGEADGHVEYELVIIGGAVQESFTATISSVNCSASAHSDFAAYFEILTIPAGATSHTGTVNMINNKQIEPSERFTLRIVRGGLDSRIKTENCPEDTAHTATITITGDDTADLTFSVTEEVVEGNLITVTLGPGGDNTNCPLPYVLKANLAVSGATSVLSADTSEPIPIKLSPCGDPDDLKLKVGGADKTSLDTNAGSGDGTRRVTFTVQDIAAEGQPHELNQRILLAQRSKTVRIIDDPCTSDGRLRFNSTIPANIDVFSNDDDGTTITLPSWSGQVCWAQVHLGYAGANQLQVYHANGKTMAGTATTVEANDAEYSVDQATRELTIKMLTNNFGGAFWDVEEAYLLYPFDGWTYNPTSAVVEQVFRIRMHNMRQPNAGYGQTGSSVRITASAGSSYSPYPDHAYNSGGFEVQRCLSSTGCAADTDWTRIRRTSYSTGTDWSLDFTTTVPDPSVDYRYRTRQYVNTRHGGGAHNGPWGSVWTSDS